MRLLFLTLVTLFTWQTFAQPPVNFPFEWQLSADSELLQTTNNLSNSGATVPLANNGEFFFVAAKFNLTYRLNPRWQFYGGADYAYSKSSLANVDRTTGGIPYVGGGIRYFLPIKKFELIPVFDGKLAVNNVDAGSDDVLISDGVSKVTLGLWALAKFKTFIPYGFAGFVYHTDDLASPFILSLGTSLDFSPWTFFAEINHFATAIDDTYVKTPNIRWSLVNQVNAGSYRFYSVNPIHTDVALGVTYLLTPEWYTALRFDYTLEGQRYSQGFTANFLVAWRFGTTDADKEIISKPIDKKKPVFEKKFKDKLEDEDQDLFE